MRKKKISLTLCYAVALAVIMPSCSSDEPAANKGDNEEIFDKIELTQTEIKAAEQSAGFQMDMFAEVTESYDQWQTAPDFSFSPLSAAVSLSVLANCADDANRSALTAMMGSTALEDLNSYNAKLLAYLPVAAKSETLQMANGLWYAEDNTLDPAFDKILADAYGVKSVPVDFTVPGVSEQINTWVSKRTDGMIDKVLNPGEPGALTELIFANAMYYKGLWAKPFDKKNTMPRTFAGVDGMRKVPMMNGFVKIAYKAAKDAKVGRMDFVSGRMSLYLILPEESIDVIAYASALDNKNFSELTDGLTEAEVNVTMPKFKSYSDFDLGTYMNSKGVDLSHLNIAAAGIDRDVLVSIRQNTCFQVDEEGVKASAATTDHLLGSAEPGLKTLTLNRPFIYILRENTTGAVLMGGVIRSMK